MTEEKRIISNGEVILVQDKNGVLAFTDGLVDKKMYEVTVTFDELFELVDDAIAGIGCYDDSNLMLVEMIAKFDVMNTEKLAKIIWDKYGKPVPEKKWYVKVPHAYNTFYHKWFDSDVLGAQSVQGVNNQLNKLDNSCMA